MAAYCFVYIFITPKKVILASVILSALEVYLNVLDISQLSCELKKIDNFPRGKFSFSNDF